MRKIIAFLAAMLVLVALCSIAVAAPASRDGTKVITSFTSATAIPAAMVQDATSADVTISPHAAIGTRMILSKDFRSNGDGARPRGEGYIVDKGAVTSTRVWPIIAIRPNGDGTKPNGDGYGRERKLPFHGGSNNTTRWVGFTC